MRACVGVFHGDGIRLEACRNCDKCKAHLAIFDGAPTPVYDKPKDCVQALRFVYTDPFGHLQSRCRNAYNLKNLKRKSKPTNTKQQDEPIRSKNRGTQKRAKRKKIG